MSYLTSVVGAMALGLVHFGWLHRDVASCQGPYRMVAGMMLRLVLVAAGLYLLAGSSPVLWLLALGGFLLGRQMVFWRQKVMVS